MNRRACVLWLVAMVLSINVCAAGAIEGLAQQCFGCHGVDGISTHSSTPNLKGQKKEYLVYALKVYRSKERVGGAAVIMHGNASPLSDNDINVLADYYSRK